METQQIEKEKSIKVIWHEIPKSILQICETEADDKKEYRLCFGGKMVSAEIFESKEKAIEHSKILKNCNIEEATIIAMICERVLEMKGIK